MFREMEAVGGKCKSQTHHCPTSATLDYLHKIWQIVAHRTLHLTYCMQRHTTVYTPKWNNQGQHSSTGSSDYYKMLHAAVIHCNIVYMWNTFLHLEYHNICKLITCKRVRDSKVQMKIKIKGGALLKSFGDEGTFREAQSSQVHQSNFVCQCKWSHIAFQIFGTTKIITYLQNQD